ncbi:S8 family peptidase [Flindersiella endophytica]
MTRKSTWRRPLAFAAAAVTAIGGVAALSGSAGAAVRAPEQAPLLGAGKTTAVKGEYIVVLKEGVSASRTNQAKQSAKADGGKVKFTYSHALNGYAADLSSDALASVRANPDVDYVQAVQKVGIDETQTPVTWGIDRLDQRALPLSDSYTYTSTGEGVTAYIIDTGIRTSHQDFGGRATSGFDAIDGGTADDGHGHGTHVAGTVGSNTYGVAKGVSLVAVRVLDDQGSGTDAQVIAGIDWVTENHQAGAPAVANMSLGGGVSASLDAAVEASIADGVTYALAAGNDYGGDACDGSPGRVAPAITVGSTDSSDNRSSFSNIGSCVDIFAPGSDIESLGNSSDTATATMSGTSMATPHVTGAAALYLDANPSATPAQVASGLTDAATPDAVGDPGSGSPNKLLFTEEGEGTGEQPPSACSDLATVNPGTLASGASQYLSSADGFTAGAGAFSGCLDGPDGADFDLYLQKKGSLGTWTTVARGITDAADEEVTYTGTAGTYRWRVHAYSGSGAYTLGYEAP